jgi:soluble lytic murein transglycosylase-like protein
MILPLALSIALALSNASDKTGVPLGLLHAVARVESDYHPRQVSNRGAVGLLQVMPKHYPGRNLFNPWVNAYTGAKILKHHKKTFKTWPMALAAYNWGPGNVKNFGAHWPKSVHKYVGRICKLWGHCY